MYARSTRTAHGIWSWTFQKWHDSYSESHRKCDFIWRLLLASSCGPHSYVFNSPFPIVCGMTEKNSFGILTPRHFFSSSSNYFAHEELREFSGSHFCKFLRSQSAFHSFFVFGHFVRREGTHWTFVFISSLTLVYEEKPFLWSSSSDFEAFESLIIYFWSSEARCKICHTFFSLSLPLSPAYIEVKRFLNNLLALCSPFHRYLKKIVA